LPDRRVLRVVTTLLLMWIAVDLAAVHLCEPEGGHGPAPASRHQTVAASEAPGNPVNHDAPIGPEHCFCHGISTGAGHVLPVAPRGRAEAVRESPAGRPLQASAALYHPPQLPA
jgi:hypothetical protein